jgi:hypothetical protein
MAGSSDPQPGKARPAFRLHPLLGLSEEHLRQYVLDFTASRFPSRTGAPELLLMRPVTFEDLRLLGFGAMQSAGQEAPMTLAILRGDFVVTRTAFPGGGILAPSARPTWANYLVFAFDMRMGGVTFLGVYPNILGLRRALNDPGLPEDPSDNAPLPPPAPPRMSSACPCGSVIHGTSRSSTPGSDTWQAGPID